MTEELPGIIRTRKIVTDLRIRAEKAEAEVERLTNMLALLGFCPKDGDAMPCMTCGAGL